MSKVYKHSGTFGDLIYSLFAVERMGGGTIAIALNNIENCVSDYAYKPEEVDEAHRGRFTQADFDMLKPLLLAQPYIDDVIVWDGTHDVDLDKFRGVLFRGFEGNYVQAMCMTHDLEFKIEDYDKTWLTAATNKVSPIVVNRTLRYRDMEQGDAVWRKMYNDGTMGETAIFLGNEREHEDFINMIGPIQHYAVKNLLEMAAVINGADLFVGNQSVAYSLAMGMGKTSVLETIKIKPLHNNECFFPRNNITYF